MFFIVGEINAFARVYTARIEYFFRLVKSDVRCNSRWIRDKV